MFRVLRMEAGQRAGVGCYPPTLSPQRLEGDLELLAVFTHVVMAVSVAALLLTAAVLLSLRSLKSNMRGIHANVAAALGVAELLFLLGIHRTHNQVQEEKLCHAQGSRHIGMDSTHVGLEAAQAQ